MKRRCWWMVAVSGLFATAASAQQCVPQSRMQPADRSALVQAAIHLMQSMQRNDTAAVRSVTVPQYAQDFSGIAAAVSTTAPHLANATFQPSTLWILDASNVGNGSDGSPQDTQFFCNLNGGSAETSFMIRRLPAGRYALAVVDTNRPGDPWQIAMLLQQGTAGTWQMAGLFPRATTAAGHDGLWYWRAARSAATSHQAWTSWIDYREAEQLLKPVSFIGSSNLDQLRDEEAKAAPPALSNGIGNGTPLVLRGKDGTEFRIVGLGPDSSLASDRIDVAMHYQTDPLADPVAARARNRAAAAALVDSYPELREHFHGVWAFAESPNAAPFASEEPMAQIP